MKRTISLLLALVMLASLLAGCGGGEETAQAVPEAPAQTTAAPTTEPTTAPTLSPEELLYQSLTDRLREAVDVGLVELEALTDLNRVVTVAEASQMLQKAYVHRTGVESQVLRDLMADPVLGVQNATRGWIMQIPGLTDMERIAEGVYEDLTQWWNYLTTCRTQGVDCSQLWWSVPLRLRMSSPEIIQELSANDGAYEIDAEGTVIWNMWHGQLPEAPDLEDIYILEMESRLYGPEYTTSGWHVPVQEYGFKVFDSTTGQKYFSLEDGLYKWTKEITLAELCEYALVFYNYPDPMAYPTYLAPEEVGKYNTDIITLDLLTKETDLPTPSCQELPASWHGVVMGHMSYEDKYHTDDYIQEYEIQAVKDAGFNYIGLYLDFNWLQEYWLTNENYQCYRNFVQPEDEGKLSLEHLEQLDQVIAWCMERDIHVNLRAVSTGWVDGSMFYKLPKAEQFASLWQAIARRYADIPNEYLSFTLFSNCNGWGVGIASNRQFPSHLLTAVDAIREETPERCMIMEIYDEWHGLISSEAFAEKGVALSYRISERLDDNVPNIWNLWCQEDFKQITIPRSLPMNVFKREEFVKRFTWPYEGMDAQALLTTTYKSGESMQEAMDTAKEYGVGFMLSDFGIRTIESSSDRNQYPRYRYPDEAYQAMILDITSTMEELGYGWCFASWYGTYGVAFCQPAIQDSTYVQVENYPYYIDQTVLGWFKEINGVS